jgi:hypothetical protein
LRYISSTSHSFCPNGELVLLTAAARLDSSVRQARFVTLATSCKHVSAHLICGGTDSFRPIKANPLPTIRQGDDRPGLRYTGPALRC